MMNTRDYLEAVRRITATQSNYSIAKTLGISPSSVVNYLNHGKSMDDRVSVKVAEALSIDPSSVVISVQIERAKDPTVKKALKDILSKLSATAASLLMVLGLLAQPSPAMANQPEIADSDLPIVMIMRSYILEL